MYVSASVLTFFVHYALYYILRVLQQYILITKKVCTYMQASALYFVGGNMSPHKKIIVFMSNLIPRANAKKLALALWQVALKANMPLINGSANMLQV